MKSVDCSIRRAVAADLDDLTALFLALQDHVEALPSELWHMTDEARGQIRAQLVARLEAAGSCALVAEAVGDGVVGMAFARIMTNHRYRPSRTGIIDQVFVRGAHRRQGVGAGLVAELSRFFAAEGVEDISLRYAVGNAEAEAFWGALGFAPRILTAGVSLRVLEVRMECTAPAHKAPRA